MFLVFLFSAFFTVHSIKILLKPCCVVFLMKKKYYFAIVFVSSIPIVRFLQIVLIKKCIMKQPRKTMKGRRIHIPSLSSSLSSSLSDVFFFFKTFPSPSESPSPFLFLSRDFRLGAGAGSGPPTSLPRKDKSIRLLLGSILRQDYINK